GALDPEDRRVVGPQHGGRAGRGVPEGRGAERAAARARRPPRVARAIVHPSLLHRDDQRPFWTRVPDPPVGGESSLRSDVRLDHRGGRARLRERPAPPPRATPALTLAGGRRGVRVLRPVALLIVALAGWEVFA